MPHIHVEYSDNLEIQARPLLKALNSALFTTGYINSIHDIKSRAVVQHEFVVGLDDQSIQAYVHTKVSLLTGRSIAVQKQISTVLLQVLQQHVKSTVDLQLCVEIQEMNKETYSKVFVSTKNHNDVDMSVQ